MNALVTGGGGFLGSAIIRFLRARGAAVRSLARSDYPALRALGVETHQGDVADPTAATSCFMSRRRRGTGDLMPTTSVAMSAGHGTSSRLAVLTE